MLHATEVLGGEAYDAQGNFVGRVSELFIEPADQPNRVARYLLGRGKYLPLLARHDQISSVAPGVIKLNVEEKELEHFHPNEAWLAVRKDLLDQQIIDTRGRKVVRVNDVDLAEQRTNGTVELRVTDVDVGLTGATHRLLQGLASPMLIRRIQQKLPARTIRWEFVNLIEPDPLRRVKLRITHDKLERMHPADLADIMEELSPAERQAIIASLDEESAAEALAELDSRLTSQIVEKMAPGKAADIIEEMEPDKAADVLAAFKTYYATAELSDVTDPNLVYNLRAKLDAAGHYDDFEVDRVAAVELNPNAKQSELVAAVEVPDHRRARALADEVDRLVVTEGACLDRDRPVGHVGAAAVAFAVGPDAVEPRLRDVRARRLHAGE